MKKVKITGLPKANNGAQIMWGGNAEQTFNPYDGGTATFKGNDHSEGGIGVQYQGNQAEVEHNEPAFVDNEGSLQVFGALHIPGTKKTFKSLGRKIANEEAKTNKQLDKASSLLEENSIDDPFQLLSFNSGKVLQDAVSQKFKSLSEKKEMLADIQNTMLDLSEKTGKSPEKISKMFAKGGTLPKARRGAKVDRGFDSESISSVVSRAAEQYELDPQLLLSQVQTESGFNTNAESNKGAIGFAQFLPETAKRYGLTPEQLKSNRPEDIAAVADAQAHHMRDLLNANGGDPKLALIAYNGGQGAINKVRGWMGNPNATGDDIMSYWEQKRTKGASKDKNAYHNQTYEYVNSILGGGNKQAFRENYYMNELPELAPPSRKSPPIDFTPVPATPQQLTQAQLTQRGIDNPIPPSTRGKVPSLADQNRLGLSQLLPEIAALTDRADFVPGQHYTPDLYQPYQVSFQDRLNQNNSSFKALTKQLVNNPSALATLAAQKYNADQQILGEQFRTNQAIANDVTNKNVSLINDAELKNIQLNDTQFVRQAQAEANTESRKFAALNSISSKVAQNRRDNTDIRLRESMFDYRYNPTTGKMEYVGPDAVFGPQSLNMDNRVETTLDGKGNIVKKKITDEPFAVDEERRQRAQRYQWRRFSNFIR